MSNIQLASHNPPQLLNKTGISGLDDILSGGLPAHRFYLIQGDPGVGKTTLALQFLMEGQKAGEKGLYITLSESKDELMAVAHSHGWSLDGLEIIELAAMEQHILSATQNTLFHPAEVELTQTVEMLLKEVERLHPSRVVFDSLSEIRLLAQDSLRYRRQMLSFKQYFAQKKCTVLLLDDRTSGESDLHIQSIAHGVLSLQRLHNQIGSVRRQITVVKLRGAVFQDGYHDYNIRTGGLDRGTSNLIMGPAGAGKSTIACQYAVAAAERGEKVAIYMFDENLYTLSKRAGALGMDLSRHVESGRIIIHHVDAAELSPGEMAASLREAVERDGVRLVIIDSLNGYLNAMPEERFLSLQLHELLSYLSQQGVVSILIMAQHGLLGDMQAPADLTYLADTVLLIRYFELSGTVKKALSVIKKRSGHHEGTIREFGFLDHRLAIGPPLEGFQGVLRGVPTFEGEYHTLLNSRSGKACALQSETLEDRILILTPSRHDVDITYGLLSQNGFHPIKCRSLEDLTQQWMAGAGVLLIAEEALSNSGMPSLLNRLARQPAWSDLPIILLTSGGDVNDSRMKTLNAFSPVGNVTFLERPFRKMTLLSSLRVALRARRKQYQQRDMLDTLKNSEERLRLALNAGKIGVWEWDIPRNRFSWPERLERGMGPDPHDDAQTMEDFAASCHPEDTPRFIECLRNATILSSGFEIEFRLQDAGGEMRWLYSRAQIWRNAEGIPLRMVGAALDISQRKRAEEDFHKHRESRMQSQKLEAIGKLAGGIAHDFNNMLTAINGYAEMMLPNVKGLGMVEEGMEEILKSGKRAASLTHQLLAYSRQQIMAFQLLDLNKVVSNLGGLLKRLIREDIVISFHLENGLPNIKADPTQTEQIILNLVLNARDALPHGGRIEISTFLLRVDRDDSREFPSVEKGTYIRLTVRDNGIGMDDKIKNRIFEPFFTTKEIGKGTGMGLSTAYGIVKQTAGHILVESEIGKGSLFTVLFPIAKGAKPAQEISTLSPSINHSGKGTLLVVEDEESVRLFLGKLLQSKGYNVLIARHGEDALAIESGYPGEIHLMLADMVMPGLNGRELAEKLARKRPAMKIIFMSGYTDDALLNHSFPDGEVNLLKKPFSPSVLFETLARALSQLPVEKTSSPLLPH